MLQPDQKDDSQKVVVAATSTESNAVAQQADAVVVAPIDETGVGDGRYSKATSSAAASDAVDFALFSPSNQAVSSDELGGRMMYPITGQTEPEDSLVKPKPPPPQEPSKKEVDEAVLTRRRAMNTIHSRRKRERQRIEIEVLKEQCTEFTNKNMAIRQENVQLEALLLSLQSRGTQQEATTNQQTLSSYHQPQQTQLPQQLQHQQPQPQIYAPMLIQQPFQGTSYPSIQSLQGNDASGNNMMPQNEQQFTENLHESIRQQMAMLQQLQPVAQQQQQPNNNIYNNNNAGNNIVCTNSNNSAQSNPTAVDAANAVTIAILQQYAITAVAAAAANSQQQQRLQQQQQMQQQQQHQPQSFMTPQLQQQFLLAQQLYLQQQIQQQQQQNSMLSQPQQSATTYNQLSFGENHNNNNVNNDNNPPQPPSRTE